MGARRKINLGFGFFGFFLFFGGSGSGSGLWGVGLCGLCGLCGGLRGRLGVGFGFGTCFSTVVFTLKGQRG